MDMEKVAIELGKELWRKKGKELKKQREKLGVNIQQVADGIGVTPHRINRLEKGEPVLDGFMMERAYIYFLELLKNDVCPFSVSWEYDRKFC